MHQAVEPSQQETLAFRSLAWWATISGFCAVFVGVGLARFSYTPLVPALIEAGWFSPSATGYLGAANLIGYLLGALAARGSAARFGAANTTRAAMAVATMSLFACAVPLSLTWYFAWRLIAGCAGGILMVTAPPAALSQVFPARRGLAGGIIFTGVGLGIAASGTIVPLFLGWGLTETWCALGLASLAATALGWNGLAVSSRAPVRPQARASAPATASHSLIAAGLALLFAEYALNAVGLVPHMVFLVDFVARGLALGLHAGATIWVVFGLGAAAGPAIAGLAADRIGFSSALRLALLLQAMAVGLPLVSNAPIALCVSAAIMGAFTPGVVPLVLGRVHDLLPHDADRRSSAWSMATIAFALGQAGASAGFAFLFAQGGSHLPLFAGAAAAIALALVLDLAGGRFAKAIG